MSANIEVLAQRLKELRAERKISLDKTAIATGVSKAMLGQIERCESSPTVATLWKIASGLNISFSSLISPSSTGFETSPLQGSTKDSEMDVIAIFPFNSETKLEIYSIHLYNTNRILREAHQAGVIEHITVIEGALELFFDGTWHPLKQGESLRFHADQAHGYAALSAQAHFHNVIAYT